MKANEMFRKLELAHPVYSFFRRGTKYVQFSTGGWSENEELISELKKSRCFNHLLIKWEVGGHYTFKIPSKDILEYDFDKNSGVTLDE